MHIYNTAFSVFFLKIFIHLQYKHNKRAKAPEVWDRGSVVIIATSYGWTVRASNVVRGKRLSLLQNCPDRLWGPPSLVLSGYQGVKRLMPKVHRSPPSFAEVKNEWTCTSTPRTCLHGVDRVSLIPLRSRNGTPCGHFLTC
jgi:hypothetical protein